MTDAKEFACALFVPLDNDALIIVDYAIAIPFYLQIWRIGLIRPMKPSISDMICAKTVLRLSTWFILYHYATAIFVVSLMVASNDPMPTLRVMPIQIIKADLLRCQKDRESMWLFTSSIHPCSQLLCVQPLRYLRDGTNLLFPSMLIENT